MHKARGGIGEVPYCLPRSPVKFQGHTGRKIDNRTQNGAFSDCYQFEYIDGYEVMLAVVKEAVLLFL